MIDGYFQLIGSLVELYISIRLVGIIFQPYMAVGIGFTPFHLNLPSIDVDLHCEARAGDVICFVDVHSFSCQSQSGDEQNGYQDRKADMSHFYSSITTRSVQCCLRRNDEKVSRKFASRICSKKRPKQRFSPMTVGRQEVK